MRHSEPHAASVPSDPAERPNLRANGNPLDGGKPPHRTVVLAEALVEALVAIDDARERRHRTALALLTIARAEEAEAARLAAVVRPEVERGYAIAEQLATEQRRAA